MNNSEDYVTGDWKKLHMLYCYQTSFICPMHSKSNTETFRFSAEKSFIHKAAKQGERRTNLKSAPAKARGWGYLWDK